MLKLAVDSGTVQRKSFKKSYEQNLPVIILSSLPKTLAGGVVVALVNILIIMCVAPRF